MSAPDLLAGLDREIEQRGDEPYAKEMREVRAAVADLVERGRKLRLDRQGIQDTHERFCAPVLVVEDVRAFTAAVSKFGGEP